MRDRIEEISVRRGLRISGPYLENSFDEQLPPVPSIRPLGRPGDGDSGLGIGRLDRLAGSLQ